MATAKITRLMNQRRRELKISLQALITEELEAVKLFQIAIQRDEEADAGPGEILKLKSLVTATASATREKMRVLAATIESMQ